MKLIIVPFGTFAKGGSAVQGGTLADVNALALPTAAKTAVPVVWPTTGAGAAAGVGACRQLVDLGLGRAARPVGGGH